MSSKSRRKKPDRHTYKQAMEILTGFADILNIE